MLNWLGLPVQASAHAAELDQMTALVHWLMLVLFVGWGLFFLFVLVRFRKGANPTASYAGAKGKLAKSTEVLVAIIEIVLLVFYAIPAWATRVGALPSEIEAFVVRVVAEQFAWNVQYPGRDGRFGRVDIKLVSADNPLGLDRTDANAKDDIATINQLNLPVDRPILVRHSSK
jgi:cytochrome c oxidase subunit 2